MYNRHFEAFYDLFPDVFKAFKALKSAFRLGALALSEAVKTLQEDIKEGLAYADTAELIRR